VRSNIGKQHIKPIRQEVSFGRLNETRPARVGGHRQHFATLIDRPTSSPIGASRHSATVLEANVKAHMFGVTNIKCSGGTRRLCFRLTSTRREDQFQCVPTIARPRFGNLGGTKNRICRRWLWREQQRATNNDGD
jgi:hypothetical protein